MISPQWFGLFCFYFPLFIISIISPMVFCSILSISVIIPPSTGPHTSSCPMVLTTTVLPIPLTCIATGGVWAQGQPLPSPSSLLHLHPPPPHPVPPVHGHVLPQLCYQTTLPTARWAPWFLHHESRAGRFVLLLGLDEQFIPLLLVNSWFNMQALFSFYCCWMYEYIFSS